MAQPHSPLIDMSPQCLPPQKSQYTLGMVQVAVQLHEYPLLLEAGDCVLLFLNVGVPSTELGSNGLVLGFKNCLRGNELHRLVCCGAVEVPADCILFLLYTEHQ